MCANFKCVRQLFKDINLYTIKRDEYISEAYTYLIYIEL